MGRQTVSRAEAAAMLGRSERSLTNYTRQGLLTPMMSQRGREYYADEVDALKEGLDTVRNPESLMVRLVQLSVQNQALTRRLERVEAILGFDVPVLSHAEKDVISEYWRAEYFASNPVYQTDVIRDFTKVLIGMDEDFLQLVELYTEDREPWRVFLQAADSLKQHCPKAGIIKDEELSAAQQQLQVARNMLEQRATLYVTRRDGERAAYTSFPKQEPSVHQRVFTKLPSSIKKRSNRG